MWKILGDVIREYCLECPQEGCDPANFVVYVVQWYPLYDSSLAYPYAAAVLLVIYIDFKNSHDQYCINYVDGDGFQII